MLCLGAEDMQAAGGVSGNNYYERLMPILGAHSIHKSRVITAYRSVALTFWGALNNWLEDLQGVRGLPTAYSFSHEYIGLPMSQALIRGVERDQLRVLFAELGLPPRARLSDPDMRALLDQWIQNRRSTISHGLRTLWASPAARERIVEVAGQLLATWEPREPGSPPVLPESGRSSSAARPRSVQLTVRLVSFPVPSLELGIVGSGELEQPSLALEITDCDGQPGSIPLQIEALPGERWAIEDPERLDPQSLLSSHLQLRASTGTVFGRRPRGLIPFVRDDLLQSFVEVERLTLGADGILLCTDQLADTAERALEQVARPGFRRRAAPVEGELSWTLFNDVQILAPLPAHDPSTATAWGDDLNVLQPLAAGQVLIEGGLQLPGRVRRWSSLAPPELRIVSDQAQRLQVSVRQTRALGGSQAQLDQALTGPAAVIDLAYLGLSDGDYEIRVDAGSATGKLAPLGQAVLRLRSGDVPNPLAGPPEVVDADRPRVVAATSSSSTVAISVAAGGSALTPGWWLARQQERRPGSSDGRRGVRLVVAGRPTAPCFETGKHHLDYPTFFGRAGSGSVEGTCRGCGLVKRSPASYRPSRGGSSLTVRRGPELRVSSVPAVQHSHAVNPDTVLDALSHDVRGPLSALDRLAVQVEDSALFVRQLTRNLISLGHLTIHSDAATGTQWQVAPSALRETSEGVFVLVGARSRHLLAALTEAAETFGAKTEHDEQSSAPARVRLHGPATLIRQIIDRLSGADLKVGLSLQTPEELVAAAPPMSTLVASIPRQAAPGASNVQRWDDSVARWRPAPSFSAPGIYSLRSGGRSIYCLRDAHDVDSGTIRTSDVATIKHGAALLKGDSLLGYDADAHAIYVPLGADLPAPYAHAAVACSGLVPQAAAQRGVLIYPEIPPGVAGRLHDLLTH